MWLVSPQCFSSAIREQLTETDLWMTQLSIDQEQTERVQGECLRIRGG